MYALTIVFLCIFAFISLLNASCLSSQTNGNAAFSVQQHQNYPVDTTYCINYAIRIQADDDKFIEFHAKDYEFVAKSFLLQLNSTIRNRINIDCANNQNVQTGDKSVSYSYNCCKNSDTINDIVCDDPNLIDINNGSPTQQPPQPTTSNSAIHQIISYTILMGSVLVYCVYFL